MNTAEPRGTNPGLCETDAVTNGKPTPDERIGYVNTVATNQEVPTVSTPIVAQDMRQAQSPVSLPDGRVDRALYFVDLGFGVYPTKPGLKKPVVKEWQHKALTTRREVEQRYGEISSSRDNMILTLPNHVVLDIDPKNGGVESLAKLVARYGELPATRVHHTASGTDSEHYIFRRDPNRPLRNKPLDAAEYPGIDIKTGYNALIVAPGSEINGSFYGITSEDPAAVLPEFVYEIRAEADERRRKVYAAAGYKLGKHTSPTKAVEALRSIPTDSPERGNDWLCELAGHLARVHTDYDAYRDALRSIDLESTDPHAEDRFDKTANSIWTRQQDRKETAVTKTAKTAWPESAEVPSNAPIKLARACLDDLWTPNGCPLIKRWRGSWLLWTGAHWRDVEKQTISKAIQDRLEDAYVVKTDDKGAEYELPLNPGGAQLNDVANALKNLALLDEDTESGTWLDGRSAKRVIAFRNGLLDIETRKLSPVSPTFFNTTSLPYDYEETDKTPTVFLGFLGTLWPNDPESIELLQEWFGYVLSGRTDLEKALMLLGPRRSGKGTILALLEAMVGAANYTGPTLSSLAQNFGLAPLINKSVAAIDDARTPTRDRDIILERLLSVIGRGVINVDRKNREAWTGRIPARVVMATNELPSFADPSGAFAGRFLILSTVVSFYGREDPTLKDRLLPEIPAIVRWSLDGLDRLTKRGYFVEPSSSASNREDFEDATARIKVFVETHCKVGSDEKVVKNHLFRVWVSWCEAREFKPGTESTFAKQLKAHLPGVSVYRSRAKDDTNHYFVGVRYKGH